MTEARSVTVRLSLENAQYLAAAIESGVAMEGAMRKGEAAVARADLAHEKLQRTAKRTAVVLVAGLAAAGKAAVDWEQQWAGVLKTVDGTDEQLNRLEGDLRTIATTLPASHKEITGVAEAAGQLGVQTENVASFTKTMIDLGETTNLTAEQAATSIAQLTNVMRTAPEDVDNLGAALVALGNNGASTEEQIILLSQRMAGAARQVGLTEADVLGLGDAIASMGINVEAGGTAVSRIFTKIAKSVAEGDEKLQIFAETAGVSVDEFTQSFERDPARAFASFLAGLNAINEAGGNVFGTLDRLGLSDVRVSRALLSMSAAGDYLTNSLDLSAQAWEENTALADEAARRYETTGSQIQVAWNRIRDAGISAGETLLPAIAAIAEGVGDLADGFAALPGPVRNSFVGLASIGALVAGGAWIGSKAITTLRNFGASLEQVGVISQTTRGRLDKTAGFLAGPWGLAVAGATVLLTQLWLEHVKAEAEIASFNATLDESSGAITEQTYREAADALKDWRDAAEEAGISAGELVTAVIQGGGALDDVIGRFSDYRRSNPAAVLWDEAKRDTYDFEDRLREVNSRLRESQDEWEFSAEAVQGYGDAASEAASASDENAQAMSVEAEAARRNAEAMAKSADALQKRIDKLREARTQALRGRSAEVNYREAILDAKDAIKENGKTVDLSTRKGIANRRALDGLAASWNELSDQAKNTPGAYKGAIKTFVDLAGQMGIGEDKARKLAKRLFDLPPKREVKVVTDTAQAERSLDAVKARLDALKNKTITVTQLNAYKGGPKIEQADGGTVPGQRHPYGDKIHALLAPGEEVISNRHGQADRFRADRAAGRIPRYADGGTVGYADGGTVAGSRSIRDVRDLGDAARDSARQLRGEARERRQALAQQRAEIRTNVAGNFRSDPFATSSSWFAPDPLGVLKGDIREARQYRRLIRQLRRKGLDGAALGSITDLDQARAVRSLGGRGIREYERLYRTRQRVSSAAGGTLAGGVVGGRGGGLGETNRRLAELEKAVDRSAARTGAEVAKRLRSATAEGMDRGGRS